MTLKTAIGLVALSFSWVLFAAPKAQVIYNCKVTELNKKIMDSFGEDLNLRVYQKNVDHIQPEAFVHIFKFKKNFFGDCVALLINI